MARRQVNNVQERITGFWTREGDIEGRVTKKVTTKDDNVFYLLRVTKAGGTVKTDNGEVVEATVGAIVGIGRVFSTECLGDLVDAPGIVYLHSNGKKDLDNGQTFWDISVEHDDEAPVPGEQQKLRHRKVDAKDPLPGEDKGNEPAF